MTMCDGEIESVEASLRRERDALTADLAGYKESDSDHQRLVRELDVLLNGDGAAKQASLCDLVGQVNACQLPVQRREFKHETRIDGLEDKLAKMTAAKFKFEGMYVAENKLKFAARADVSEMERTLRSEWFNRVTYKTQLRAAEARIAALQATHLRLNHACTDLQYQLTDSDKRVGVLEAGIAQWASECADCNGAGFFMVPVVSKLGGNLKQECQSCAFIRELLKPPTLGTPRDAPSAPAETCEVGITPNAKEGVAKYTGPAGYRSAICELCGRMFMDHSEDDLARPQSDEKIYNFDRLRNGKRMAEGGEVHAHSEPEAFERIRRLFSDCPATDRFVLTSTRPKNPQPAEQSIAHVEAQIKGDAT